MSEHDLCPLIMDSLMPATEDGHTSRRDRGGIGSAQDAEAFAVGAGELSREIYWAIGEVDEEPELAIVALPNRVRDGAAYGRRKFTVDLGRGEHRLENRVQPVRPELGG